MRGGEKGCGLQMKHDGGFDELHHTEITQSLEILEETLFGRREEKPTGQRDGLCLAI